MIGRVEIVDGDRRRPLDRSDVRQVRRLIDMGRQKLLALDRLAADLERDRAQLRELLAPRAS